MWCQGQHVFRYRSPVARIFVLSGSIVGTYVKEVLDGKYAAVDDEGVADMWRSDLAADLLLSCLEWRPRPLL